MADQRGNIAQFNSPDASFRPTDEGAHAYSEAGYMEGKLYRQAGDYYAQAGAKVGGLISEHETMSEINQGSAALAAMHNNLTTQWNKTASSSDPNDTSIQKDFLDNTVEPQLQQFQNGFTTEAGQKWAMDRANDYRQHYYEKTSADMSARAGDAVMQNAKVQLNQLSDAARTDPTSMSASLNQVDAYVQATKDHNTGNLSPEQIDKLNDISHDMKNEIVKSGLQGLADVNPKAAVGAINSGKFSDYISGTEGDQLLKYSEGITRMKLEDQQRGYEAQQRAQKQAEDQKANTILGTIYNKDTGQLSIPPNINQQIFSDPTLGAKSKLDLMSSVKKLSEESSIDDPATVRGLYEGIGNGQTTQESALNALAAGKIKIQTYQEINETVKGTAIGKIDGDGFTATLDAVKKMTMGEDMMPGVKDPKGAENYAAALPAVNRALKAGLAAGVPISELYDAGNKNWIGNAAKPFVRDPSTWFTSSVTQALSPGASAKAAAPLPALTDRKEGQTYPTPRGNMTWTKSGWVPAQTQPSVPKPE